MQSQVPGRVSKAMTQPMLTFRTKEFRAMFEAVCVDLKHLFQTSGDVLTLTTSGTGAMEAAVINFLRHGDEIVTIEGGKFGERWSEIARIYGLRVNALKVPWGESVAPDDVGEFVRRHSDAAAVFLTHSETSTGVAFDVEAIAAAIRRRCDALIIVDGMSAVGVLPFFKDSWGIDVCVSASQKGAMLPPGLAFVAVNDRGWHAASRSDLPRYYLDLHRAREALQTFDTAWTPATSLIMGLRESLRLIVEEDLQRRWQRFARLAKAIREGANAMELELFARSPSNAVTAIRVPKEIDGGELVNRLRDPYGVIVAGGQEHLKGKIFRVAHMGYCDETDIVALASALESALRDLGWRFELGKGVTAVQAAYASDVGSGE